MTLEPKRGQFCKYCGYKKQPDTTIIGYDEETGLPVRPFINELVCVSKECSGKPPRRRWDGSWV